MSKDDKFNSGANFYELWMTQSKQFFDAADKNLRSIFGNDTYTHPEAHLKQINEWLEKLKIQWQQNQYMEGQKIYQDYWKFMNKLCNDAADMMLKEWIQRSSKQDHIKNIRDLYELWLKCCGEIYKKNLESISGHDTYAEFMRQALKFWQSNMPK